MMLKPKSPFFLAAVVLVALTVYGLVLVSMAADAPATGPSQRRHGGFADAGIYVGGNAWGGTLNHMRSGLDLDVNARLDDGRKAGCLNVVQFDAEKNWRGDPAPLVAQLTEWLKKNDISKIDILMLGEEHMYDAGQFLDPLYDVIKQHGDVPVYVWPSSPLGPLGKADGYGYDYYGAKYTDFRNKVVEFLSTGKPLLMCIDGSGYSDIISAREQVMVCCEFDIPAYYFTCDSGSGSYNRWLGGGAVYVPWRNFVFSALEFQRRCGEPSRISAGDMVWGEPVDLAGGYDGKIAYAWTGIGPGTVYGLKRLKIDGLGLRSIENREAAIDYQFWSLLPVQNGQLTLTLGPADPKGSTPIKVEISRCGKADQWRVLAPVPAAPDQATYNLGNPGREFRIRITLPDQAAPAVREFQLTGDVEVKDDRHTDLGLFVDGWRGGVRYRENLSAGSWRTSGWVDSPQALEPRGLAMRGASGHRVSANVVEKFVSPEPMNNIVVRLKGWCSGPGLGGSFSLGVSLDGKNIIKQGVSAGEPVDTNGVYRGVHTCDLSNVVEFQGVREFYVHMEQSNSSGNRSNVSSGLETLEIDAATRP